MNNALFFILLTHQGRATTHTSARQDCRAQRERAFCPQKQHHCRSRDHQYVTQIVPLSNTFLRSYVKFNIRLYHKNKSYSNRNR